MVSTFQNRDSRWKSGQDGFDRCRSTGGAQARAFKRAQRDAATHISHLSPSTMSCIASVQPLITCVSANGVVDQLRRHCGWFKLGRRRDGGELARAFDWSVTTRLVRREARRRAALVARVEDGAVDQLTLVVALARRANLRVEAARALPQHLVLQAALERDDALLALVLREVGETHLVARERRPREDAQSRSKQTEARHHRCTKSVMS